MDDRSSTLSPTALRPGANPAAPYAASHSSNHTAPNDASRAAPNASYSPKSLGPKYPPHTMNGPLFEPIDMAGLTAAIVITLGPLAAYSLGWGA